jgi:hypothetical protein
LKIVSASITGDSLKLPSERAWRGFAFTPDLQFYRLWHRRNWLETHHAFAMVATGRVALPAGGSKGLAVREEGRRFHEIIVQRLRMGIEGDLEFPRTPGQGTWRHFDRDARGAAGLCRKALGCSNAEKGGTEKDKQKNQA